MAKTSAVEKNRKRIRMVKKFASKRARLKAIATDQSIPAEERFAARLKLILRGQKCQHMVKPTSVHIG